MFTRCVVDVVCSIMLENVVLLLMNRNVSEGEKFYNQANVDLKRMYILPVNDVVDIKGFCSQMNVKVKISN
jgi:hypothetical protein